ncbi:phosphopantetheine-binding protein [Cellulomonas sp. Leaf334]|uniref:phosphopantetheine-binding protein n=1 Tax=Cellulomonas sp. Leaf334 TaxID=1736339 RepID=UPI0007009985|nr:phosphopantetheine-binding protein [Cellulomonas sp. Leaf334]KQR16491.1 hypothetical protein ASF78_03690 [Cellulomonas sp. Leaf334]
MSDTATLTLARDLVAAVIPDDVADAGPAEDLRDFGLDSIRLVGLVDTLRSRGADVDLMDLAAEPTLERIAALLP